MEFGHRADEADGSHENCSMSLVDTGQPVT
jgi:hypothetical protein